MTTHQNANITKGQNWVVTFSNNFPNLFGNIFNYDPEHMSEDDKNNLRQQIHAVSKQSLENVQDDLENAKNDQDKETLNHYLDEMKGIRSDFEKFFHLN